MRLGALRWVILQDTLRPTRAERDAALRNGDFLWPWTRFEGYTIEGDLIFGVGNSKRYFPTPGARFLRQLADISDESSLRRFVEKFGLLGCGEPDSEGRRREYRGDSIKLCLIHSRTLRALQELIGAVNQAGHGGTRERLRLAAEIKDVENLRVSMGDGRVGPLLVGSKSTKQFHRLQDNPFWAAKWIAQSLVNMNTEGIRPYLYFGSGMQTHTWFCFGGLYELAYWRLSQELADDRLRKCRRAECGKLFEAEHRKQVYCNRRCLDIDKQAKYTERKRQKGKKR